MSAPLLMRRVGRIRWEAAEAMQRAAVEERRKKNKGDASSIQTAATAAAAAQTNVDEVILCEHDPVYTVGRRIKNAEEEAERLRGLGADFQYALRGGQITFHGHGQLVVYPMLDLRNCAMPTCAHAKTGSSLSLLKQAQRWRMKIGPRVYIEKLEHALINTCDGFGVAAGRTEDTGVWVEDRKIAAIGVQVTHGITWHGFALNCDVNLGWFDNIVPCGIEGKEVTSLTKEAGRTVTIDDVLPIVEAALQDVFE